MAPCISVVDDDALVCRALGRLLQSAGFEVQTFTSAHDFLARSLANVPGCIVADRSVRP